MSILWRKEDGKMMYLYYNVENSKRNKRNIILYMPNSDFEYNIKEPSDIDLN